jgi:hypothetical protein
MFANTRAAEHELSQDLSFKFPAEEAYLELQA